MNRKLPVFLLATGGMCAGLLAVGDAPARANASEAAPDAFGQCLGCHSTEPGQHKFGPSLAGVSGRKAGSVPGFRYSSALKSSGLTWDAQTLDKWLTSPKATVPGTRMPFAGISDATQRREVVEHLLTLD